MRPELSKYVNLTVNQSWLTILLLILSTLQVGHAARQYKYPFLDPSLPWDKRVDDLVGRLTVDEIAKQTAVCVQQ